MNTIDCKKHKWDYTVLLCSLPPKVQCTVCHAVKSFYDNATYENLLDKQEAKRKRK